MGIEERAEGVPGDPGNPPCECGEPNGHQLVLGCAAELERIKAQAWDEGFHHGWYQDNPYRAADETS